MRERVLCRYSIDQYFGKLYLLKYQIDKKGHQKCIWLIINDRADYEFMCFYRELSLTHK